MDEFDCNKLNEINKCSTIRMHLEYFSCSRIKPVPEKGHPDVKTTEHEI